MEEFKEIFDSIESNDMREFANELLKTIPPYFWQVGASSTGKYHPAYTVGEGGLAKHTVALVRILNYMFEASPSSFTSRQKDMLRIAGMMHDTRKSGDQASYEHNKYTKHEHPLLAAEVIRKFDGKFLSHEEIELIAQAIESHMGKWTTSPRSSVTLPAPKSAMQVCLHMADYLASRKSLEIDLSIVA